MGKLTDIQMKQFKREGKVLLISSLAYAVVLVPLAFAFSLNEVAKWSAPIYFACMYLIDRNIK
jgi:hypothetical protein